MTVQTGMIRRPATYQDVLDAPPNMVAELIGGALHLQPRLRPRHVRAGSVLVGQIGGLFDYGNDGTCGWIILVEPELHLGAEVMVPDLAGWLRERMPALPEAAWFEIAPEWFCEVLSPGTRTYDVTEKREIYAEHGVRWLWFVDPAERVLEGPRPARGGVGAARGAARRGRGAAGAVRRRGVRAWGAVGAVRPFQPGNPMNQSFSTSTG